MNSLLILPDELLSPNRARLVGVRARYMHEFHDLTVGVSVRASVLGGNRGIATVTLVSAEVVELALELSLPPLEPLPLELIVAVPRPQTVKKTIQAGVSFGVQRIHFLHTEGVVKSYLSSKSLSEEEILIETIKALEQVYDSRAPEVVVHRTFSWFVDHHLPGILERCTRRIIAHGGSTANTEITRTDQSTVLAIGPESGWRDEEINIFVDAGFTSYSFGERILRVEHAIVYGIGALITPKR